MGSEVVRSMVARFVDDVSDRDANQNALNY
jgi:hypothetical protein